MNHALHFQGEFLWRKLRPVDGRLEIVAMGRMHNGITAAGLNDLLSAGMAGGTQRTWYVGLLAQGGYTALASTDTMASHAGWTEETSYSQSARPAWSPGTPAAGVIINSSAVEFTFAASRTVKGLFVASVATKGGATGILWCTGLFDTDQDFAAGEILRAYYQLTITAGAGS